jgi:hypothetical protein
MLRLHTKLSARTGRSQRPVTMRALLIASCERQWKSELVTNQCDTPRRVTSQI